MKLKYPCKNMKITQSYLGHYSHEPNRNGSPPDYPIDEAGVDRNRDWFYAPCDLQIARIYGVGNSGDNTIWMTSKEPVEMPCGKDYVTIMVVHPEDDDLKNIRVGQEFKRGERMFREGQDGKASGNHFHMSVATGMIRSGGWVKNSREAWVIFTTGRALKPEEAFFVTEDIKIISSGGLFFKPMPKEEEVGKVFKDVPDDRWSAPYIEAAKKLDIIRGDKEGNFHPTDPLTREEAAAIAARLYEKITGKGVL